MEINDFDRVFLIGIGGAGMSALARHFKHQGLIVAGYDLVRNDNCLDLERVEGIEIVYDASIEVLDHSFWTSERTLVVMTPAIPKEHEQLSYFQANGYTVMKRAEVLGLISRQYRTIGVAGTHGKTSTSTMITHLLRCDESVGCTAFLGGVSTNYNTNFLHGGDSPWMVAEADEFDRSFLHLHPQVAVVTSMEADHLDIYGDYKGYCEAFEDYCSLIEAGGYLLSHVSVKVGERLAEGVRHYTYGVEGSGADYEYGKVCIESETLYFDWIDRRHGVRLERVRLGVPIRINVENMTAAMAVASLCSVDQAVMLQAVASFRGNHRRFEQVYADEAHVLIDDYAHHPSELHASISSIKELYGAENVLGVFQPHLFSRTADFYESFAEALSQLDQVVVLDIYPAREKPMAGVTSRLISDRVQAREVHQVSKEALPPCLKGMELPRVVAMLGAGDIDRLVAPVKDYLASLQHD